MHQTKKGNNYFFGMKAHIGVDLHTGLVHSVVGTAANVADVTQVDGLLHGEEELVLGDAGYQGVGKRSEEHTSELQSLMRLSSAVFCLQKKTVMITSTLIPSHAQLNTSIAHKNTHATKSLSYNIY